MPTAPTRTSDPLTLVQLLWAPGTRVGRSGTTVGAITDAAIALADRSGLDALTMRAVAEQVGVGAMTLYGYVPGKTELLELMLDRVAAATYEGHPRPADLPDWRSALHHVAQRNYEHALAHGWSVEIPAARPILGPGICLKYEAELTPLDGIGLRDEEMDHVLTSVLHLATSAARWEVATERVRAASQLTDEQWWRLSEPVLTTVMAGLDLPVSSRVGQTLQSAADPSGTLATGVAVLLDGVAARLARS
ncbi:TetR/AcrR family transcriptional regulator [Cellulomonas sp. NS3]|uniref:TetR/AcrR family transcriptional regulator n=1 Tax=Cellulomonas sp. NS3 TaxID=2973977 RepID=UPI00216213F2|nr:TetR/AcrR family transcriptional regulator [Cellulomonas sp. NS3]